MDKRGGVWTSQTRKDDASDIRRLARQIIEKSTDREVRELAERIERKARDLEDDL